MLWRRFCGCAVPFGTSGRVAQIGLKGTRVSSIRTEVSLIRIKVFLFWRTDGCQATLFPKGTAQPLKRRHSNQANYSGNANTQAPEHVFFTSLFSSTQRN